MTSKYLSAILEVKKLVRHQKLTSRDESHGLSLRGKIGNCKFKAGEEKWECVPRQEPEFHGTEDGHKVWPWATGNTREKDTGMKGTQPDQPEPNPD